MNIELFKKLGFSDKTATVYVALLSLGPSSVRAIAEHVDINRGTVHEILTNLREQGLVSFFEQNAKQYFVAEDPEKLKSLTENKIEELQDARKKIESFIPELKSIYDRGGGRPVARYYDKDELNLILEDVLASCEKSGEMEYRIYSSSGIREYLYDGFETFSDARVAKGISVKVIAIGKGGELRGLDERKWLPESPDTQTYILVYPGKTAYISLNVKGDPLGVVIENQGVFETQKMLFDSLWRKL